MSELVEVHRRVQALEEWRQELEISRAREDENRKHMDQRFNSIEAGLKDIKAVFIRVGWVVASAVILAVVTFVLRGGLVN